MMKWIVFDVDGTLIDTAKSNILGLQYVMKKNYGKEYSEDELYNLMGIPGEAALRKIGVEEEKIFEIWKCWVDKVKEYAHYNYVFEGIKDMLESLSLKYNLGIVTSKTQAQLKEDFGQKDLLQYFKICICKEDTKKHKPNSEPLKKLLEKAGIVVEEAIYIGDALVDYKAAKSIGMKFAHCKFTQKVDNIKCETVFNKPSEITKLFVG